MAIWLVGLIGRKFVSNTLRPAPSLPAHAPMVNVQRDPAQETHPRAASVPCARSLGEAVQWTVLYASVFDYPLTREEVFRFLVPPGGSRAETDRAIDQALAGGDDLESDGEFLYPSGRSNCVATRARRREHARRAWKRARFYSRLIWSLPYVRMVAVTGALAMNNVEKHDDIDFLIVTEPGRLWMTRGMILMLARCAHIFGDTLCPNYLISSRDLRLGQQDPYTAHELAQMAPLYGRQVAERLWAENSWCRQYLPNAWARDDLVTNDWLPWILAATKSVGQTILDRPLGTRIESWERSRKIAQLSQGAPRNAAEIHYTEDICKGHADNHGRRVMERWAELVAQTTGKLDSDE